MTNNRVSHIPQLVSNDPRITIGKFTYGNPNFAIWADSEKIEVGSFCSIASGVTIFGGGEHRTDWITTYPLRIAFGLAGANSDGHPASKGATKMGHDVWLGMNSIVLSGVQIGNGAVVGAGTVVSKDVEDYCIVVGNPARVVRKRFDNLHIAFLQKLQWWNWPLETISRAAPILCSADFDKLKAFAELHLPRQFLVDSHGENFGA
jgi:acetyltransferase-like isoleucine patch superfamily enzyme